MTPRDNVFVQFMRNPRRWYEYSLTKARTLFPTDDAWNTFMETGIYSDDEKRVYKTVPPHAPMMLKFKVALREKEE